MNIERKKYLDELISLRISLKILYLCRSVRGLLPAYGLQSTPDSDKARMVNPS